MKRNRIPLLVLVIFALLAAMWAGLLRLGWRWPALPPTLPAAHGPLMISVHRSAALANVSAQLEVPQTLTG